MLNANWRIDTNMGNYLSNNAVFLSAKRALMRYNIENRAFKELEKQTQKPLAAPKHEAGIIDYHESLKSNFFKQFSIITLFWTKLNFSSNRIPDNTEYLAKTTVVNKDLDLRLKDVYVTSEGLVNKFLLLLLFILEKRSIIDRGKHFYNFDCRQKISNRTKHCHWRDGLNSKHSGTKNLIRFHWERCHYFKPSILFQNINKTQPNGLSIK